MAVEEVQSSWGLFEDKRENERDANMISSRVMAHTTQTSRRPTQLDLTHLNPRLYPQCQPYSDPKLLPLELYPYGAARVISGKPSKDVFDSVESTCFAGVTARALSEVEDGVGWVGK